MKFLITDAWTNESAWVETPSLREALIKRENELRAAGGGIRPSRPVHAKAKASHYSQGNVIDVSLGDVRCVGLRENVISE